jgi:hypothetical protein
MCEALEARMPKLQALIAISALGLAAILPPGFGGNALSQVEEDPSGIIAAHIRQQGYPCDNPQGATRDEAASQPNETVWRIECGNADYRVTLVPDMAARVETLSWKSQSSASD